MQYRSRLTLAGLALALCAASSMSYGAPVTKSKTKAAAAKPATGIYLSAMDPTVAACDDFYQRACGGYIASVKLSEAHPSLEMTNEQFEANLERSFATLFAQNVASDP
ncbi:MAG TPA: hypothetical protein VIT92_07685, partial [Burkholderiaceae bacterium]